MHILNSRYSTIRIVEGVTKFVDVTLKEVGMHVKSEDIHPNRLQSNIVRQDYCKVPTSRSRIRPELGTYR